MIRALTIAGLLAFFACSLTTAQITYPNWFFGKNAGVSFQGSNVFAMVSGSLNTTEGCASISDSTGHLLFYTNGVNVWTKTHAVMPNGTGLFGDISATQSAAILPHPGMPDLYYIATTGEWSDNVGLRYSEVDMSLNNGLGAVGRKNVALAPNISEKIAAIQHSNKRDYWLLTHRQNSNEFLAFLVNTNGIQTTPVSSLTGSPDSSAVGYLKASLDGKKLAMGFRNQHFYEVYDFNPTTGQVSNAISFPAIYYQSYGCEFSPDGRRLYIHSSRREAQSQPSQLFQVDLTGSTAGDIVSSVRVIANIGVQHPGAMQLGPDGKIYIARHNALYLGVIHFPNSLGTTCGYVDEGFYLGGRNSQFGLNNLIQAHVLPKPQLLIERTCSGDSTLLLAENRIAIDSVIWHFGDPVSPINRLKGNKVFHTYKQAGTYQIKMVYFRGKLADTLSQLVEILPKPYVDLGNDTLLCPGELLELNAFHPSTYQLTTTFSWQDNSQGPIHIANQEAIYWVEAQNVCGTYRDSIYFGYRKLPQLDLGEDTLLCEGENLFLEADVAAPAHFLWDNGQSTNWRNIDQTGQYWLYVQDACGSDRDSIEVIFEQRPYFDLGKDTLICEGDILQLDATPAQAITYTYLWENGETEPLREVSQSGQYKVRLRSNACVAEDSIALHVRMYPYVEFGPDTTICVNEPLVLRADGEAATYLWQDGSTNQTFPVNQTGTYWVEATNSCGTVSDRISIEAHKPPKVDLGSDTLICVHYPLMLDASSAVGGVRYQWENESILPYRRITQSGIYSVSLTNACGVLTDTIEVRASHEACECKLFIPNVITPNADGVNDQFVISYPCEFKHFQLQIFDRWGQPVFSSANPDNHWDGCMKKQLCPNGAYYYVISYQGKDSYLRKEERKLNTLKGVVTLLR